MGNCIYAVRPTSGKGLPNQELDSSSQRSGVRSPTVTMRTLTSSALFPAVVQQPIISSPGSPLLVPFALNRHESNVNVNNNNNHLTVGTPSSSGVSSALSSSASSSSSSSTTSAIQPKPVPDHSRLQYVVIFDYDARTKEDLTIRKNDLLEITNTKNTAWWRAKNEQGHEGWIPSNYVAKRDSLESEPYVESLPSLTSCCIFFFLFRNRWYFKSIRRIDAEKQLMSDVNDHGSFLVSDERDSMPRTPFSRLSLDQGQRNSTHGLLPVQYVPAVDAR